jgi:putative transposase
MKGKRFAAEQILRILHEAEAGGNVRDVCRQHNIAAQTLSRWRRQFGGLEVSEVKRLRALQREHAALKRLVGALPLDNRRLQAVLGKNWSAGRPRAKRQRLWSGRRTSVSDAPAGSWRCPAVRSGGRQAHGTTSSWDSAFRRSRGSLRAVALGRSLIS